MALRTRETVARIGCLMLVVFSAAIGSASAQESGALPSASRPALARLFGIRHYEYDERIDLSLDGSAIIDVNASIPALVALRGARLDVDPEARFDRQAIRHLFEGPGATVREISAFRRSGRRFAHVRLDVTDIRKLAQIEPLSWSRYQLDLVDHEYRFVQDVGPPVRGEVGEVGWTGDELVAFRVHLPSKINFHNPPDEFERGNTLAWEQTLRDRLAGRPLHMEARMETQSILYRTLWLFGGTFLAAIAVLGIIIWWVWRRGKGRSMVPA
jgi:hypothetical protein